MLRRLLIVWLIISFLSTLVLPVPRAHADDFLLGLPQPGSMVNLSPAYEPVLLKGLKIHPDNPFLFDFILDTGNSHLKVGGARLKTESNKLIKYFLASLTVPEKDLWVNLSPYEKDRMIAPNLGQTTMGRDMLAEDYILKQLTASLIYPEKHLGKTFWDEVYAKTRQMYGTTQVPMNTFNKVWIVADKADVFERGNVAYVVGAHLKVMLEEDYLALEKNTVIPRNTVILSEAKDLKASLASQIIRKIILPQIEKEVNTGKNFAPLRQMFYSMILSSWYKMALKDAILTQIYGNQSKVKGWVNQADPGMNEEIFQRYLRAYKKGVFNYIKDDRDKDSQQPIPRKYFSGGTDFESLAEGGLHRFAKWTGDDAMKGDIVEVKGIADLAQLGNSDRTLRDAWAKYPTETREIISILRKRAGYRVISRLFEDVLDHYSSMNADQFNNVWNRFLGNGILQPLDKSLKNIVPRKFGNFSSFKEFLLAVQNDPVIILQYLRSIETSSKPSAAYIRALMFETFLNRLGLDPEVDKIKKDQKPPVEPLEKLIHGKKILFFMYGAGGFGPLIVQLRKEGAIVHATEKRDEAIEWAKANNCDLVIADLSTGGTFGLDILREITPVARHVRSVILYENISAPTTLGGTTRIYPRTNAGILGAIREVYNDHAMAVNQEPQGVLEQGDEIYIKAGEISRVFTIWMDNDNGEYRFRVDSDGVTAYVNNEPTYIPKGSGNDIVDEVGNELFSIHYDKDGHLTIENLMKQAVDYEYDLAMLTADDEQYVKVLTGTLLSKDKFLEGVFKDANQPKKLRVLAAKALLDHPTLGGKAKEEFLYHIVSEAYLSIRSGHGSIEDPETAAIAASGLLNSSLEEKNETGMSYELLAYFVEHAPEIIKFHHIYAAGALLTYAGVRKLKFTPILEKANDLLEKEEKSEKRDELKVLAVSALFNYASLLGIKNKSERKFLESVDRTYPLEARIIAAERIKDNEFLRAVYVDPTNPVISSMPGVRYYVKYFNKHFYNKLTPKGKKITRAVMMVLAVLSFYAAIHRDMSTNDVVVYRGPNNGTVKSYQVSDPRVEILEIIRDGSTDYVYLTLNNKVTVKQIKEIFGGIKHFELEITKTSEMLDPNAEDKCYSKPDETVLDPDEDTVRLKVTTDKAAIVKLNKPLGGIDLTRSKMNIRQAGNGMQMRFDPAMIARIKRDGFEGIDFHIQSIVPVTDLPLLLGLK